VTNAPHTRLNAATRAEEIISLALRGESAARIARALNVPLRAVTHVLKDSAERIRRDNQKRVAVRWAWHDTLLTRLIRKWTRELLTSGFDRDLSTAVIRAMERQSRLLGLDAAPALDTDKWLNEASDEQLRTELRDKYGIEVPDALMRPTEESADA